MSTVAMQSRAMFSLVVWAVWARPAFAAPIVDPPLPVTHRVQVQMIETALSDGSSPATLFGTAAQRANIEAAIDSIWAQSGIDIAFLPSITRYDNTFAYQGYGGERPTSDLDTMISEATSAGVVNPDPHVINMFFVEIVPGFAYTAENVANGLGNIGEDGIAQFVGDSLLRSSSGRDVIAEVVAHEIGHNLGLKHAADGQPNLMSPDGTSAQLTGEQIAAVFQTTRRNDAIASIPSRGTGFPQLIPPSLPGDYNGNGEVDAADYVVWRSALGSASDLAADGNGNGIIDSGDYDVWRGRYGAALQPASIGISMSVGSAVPEPHPKTQFVCGLALLAIGRWRQKWRRTASMNIGGSISCGPMPHVACR
jgi:hypothetical protein